MITPGPKESSEGKHLLNLTQARLAVFKKLINEYLEEEDPQTHGVLYQELINQVRSVLEENHDLKTLMHLFHKTGIMEDCRVMLDKEELEQAVEG